MYLCVLCGSENKQRLFPYTPLTDWFLQHRRSVLTARYELNHQAQFWLFIAVSSLLLMPLVLALCPAARPTASAPRYTHSTDHNFRLILGSYRLTSLEIHTNFLSKTQSIAVPGHKYNHDTKTCWGRCSIAPRILTLLQGVHQRIPQPSLCRQLPCYRMLG